MIGQTTYNIADLDKYKDALSSMDLGKMNEEGFAQSYSQLFQSSGAINSLAQFRPEESSTVKFEESKSYKVKLPPILDPQKIKDPPKEQPLKVKQPKDPKVQVVKEGQRFDRRRTFIKNWDFEDEKEDS